MKRIFASALALTIASPVVAGSTDHSTDADAAIQMDGSWNMDSFADFDAPEIEPKGWVVAGPEQMTAAAMTGMRVYSPAGDWIGEIDNVIIDASGDIQGAVLGVGGFVGIGEKDVLVSFDSLTIKTAIEGDAMRAYANMTEEQLEELPAYES